MGRRQAAGSAATAHTREGFLCLLTQCLLLLMSRQILLLPPYFVALLWLEKFQEGWNVIKNSFVSIKCVESCFLPRSSQVSEEIDTQLSCKPDGVLYVNFFADVPLLLVIQQYRRVISTRTDWLWLKDLVNCSVLLSAIVRRNKNSFFNRVNKTIYYVFHYTR